MTDLLPCPCCAKDPTSSFNSGFGKDLHLYSCCNVVAYSSSTKEGAAYNWNHHHEVVDAELKRLRDKVVELEAEVEQLKAAVKFAKWDGKHWCV